MLPFTLKVAGDSHVKRLDVRDVRYRVHGVVRLEGAALVLQWSGERHVTEVKGPEVSERVEPLPVRTLQIPGARLGLIERRGWWRPRVEVVVTDLALLEGVPGAARGRLALVIARRDTALADEFISNVRVLMADAAIAAAEAPPPLPPPPDSTG